MDGLGAVMLGGMKTFNTQGCTNTRYEYTSVVILVVRLTVRWVGNRPTNDMRPCLVV